MRKHADVESEMRDLFGQREGVNQKSKSGATIMLAVILVVGCALAAWPFIKAVPSQPQPLAKPLYYQVPVDADIIPAAFNEETVDIFFFTGCAHQRCVKPKLQLIVEHSTGEV